MSRIITAEEMARNYQKELKNIRMMRWLTLVVFLVLLWLLRDKMNPIMAVGAVLVFFLGLQFLRSMQVQQFATLQRVLNYECDATKYTAIMEQLAVNPGKEATAIKLCLARGQYCSGRFEEALETLNSFYMERPSVGTAVLYYSTAFGCHAELGDMERAQEVRQTMEALLNAINPKQRGTVQQQMLLMDAVLALKEDRYEEFFPLQKRVAEEALAPLQKVLALYYLAQGELVQGEDTVAREHLLEVMEQGCTTFMAAEAANLLEEFSLSE